MGDPAQKTVLHWAEYEELWTVTDNAMVYVEKKYRRTHPQLAAALCKNIKELRQRLQVRGHDAQICINQFVDIELAILDSWNVNRLGSFAQRIAEADVPDVVASYPLWHTATARGIWVQPPQFALRYRTDRMAPPTSQGIQDSSTQAHMPPAAERVEHGSTMQPTTNQGGGQQQTVAPSNQPAIFPTPTPQLGMAMTSKVASSAISIPASKNTFPGPETAVPQAAQYPAPLVPGKNPAYLSSRKGPLIGAKGLNNGFSSPLRMPVPAKIGVAHAATQSVAPDANQNRPASTGPQQPIAANSKQAGSEASVQAAEKKKRRSYQGISKDAPSANVPFPGDEQFAANLTIAEMMCFFPAWLRSRDVITRALSNGGGQHVLAKIYVAFRTNDQALAVVKNGMLKVMKKSMNVVHGGDWVPGDLKASEDHDPNSINVAGFKTQGELEGHVRPSNPASHVPFKDLVTGTAKLPTGADGLDLTRCVQHHLAHPDEDWMFPRDFADLIDHLGGPLAVTPAHTDAAIFGRYGGSPARTYHKKKSAARRSEDAAQGGDGSGHVAVADDADDDTDADDSDNGANKGGKRAGIQTGKNLKAGNMRRSDRVEGGMQVTHGSDTHPDVFLEEEDPSQQDASHAQAPNQESQAVAPSAPKTLPKKRVRLEHTDGEEPSSKKRFLGKTAQG